VPAGECDGRQVRHPGRVQLLCDGPAAPGGRVSQQQAAAGHHHLHRPAAHAAQMGQVSGEQKYIKGYKQKNTQMKFERGTNVYRSHFVGRHGPLVCLHTLISLCG